MDLVWRTRSCFSGKNLSLECIGKESCLKNKENKRLERIGPRTSTSGRTDEVMENTFLFIQLEVLSAVARKLRHVSTQSSFAPMIWTTIKLAESSIHWLRNRFLFCCSYMFTINIQDDSCNWCLNMSGIWWASWYRGGRNDVEDLSCSIA